MTGYNDYPVDNTDPGVFGLFPGMEGYVAPVVEPEPSKRTGAVVNCSDSDENAPLRPSAEAAQTVVREFTGEGFVVEAVYHADKDPRGWWTSLRPWDYEKPKE